MLAGGFALLILGLKEVGGWENLFDIAYPCSAPNITDPESVPESCLYPPTTWNHIIRPADDPDFPWPGVIFGMVIGSVWYWCTDQVIVQRTLSARDISNGKLGCVCAALLKILPVFLMLIPGMIARALWPDEIACKTAETCQVWFET